MPPVQSILDPVFSVALRPGAPVRHGVFNRPYGFAVLAKIGLTLAGTLLVVWAFSASISTWTPAAALTLALITISAGWISGGAATAIIGLLAQSSRSAAPPKNWTPARKTAILVTLCGEDSAPLANHLANLHAALADAQMTQTMHIAVLSDTSGPQRIALEEATLAPLIQAGTISYRRRRTNTGRKPGNLAAWVRACGDAFDHMLVLDADSRMSAWRIRAMIWRMEQDPKLGLLQAGIALIPGRSRFGHHQRLSSRLLSPNFLRGFSAWTGPTGNYWGHNALIHVAAFREALDLPVLSGSAPFGGELLSHDFVEAAMIRRAGWDVHVEPSFKGSAEDAPQTLGEFSRRDRRWCQGNLQHVGVVGEQGLRAGSRAHLVFGIISYVAAPIWLALLVVLASGAVQPSGALPLIAVLVLLLVPKLCALADHFGKARTFARRAVIARAFIAELAFSALLAPLTMVRQTGAVLAVLMGRDCGWKSDKTPKFVLPKGLSEMAVGATLAVLAVVVGNGFSLWLVPVLLPLVLAPLVINFADAPAGR